MLVTQQPTIFVSSLDCLTSISVSVPFSYATRLIRKANSTFMMFKRNLSPVISEATRLNTHKTLVSPIISYGSAAWYPSKSETSVFLKIVNAVILNGFVVMSTSIILNENATFFYPK